MARVREGGIDKHPLRLGRRDRARPAALLPRAGPAVPHRVRRVAGWRQPHPLGVARLQRRLRARPAARALRDREGHDAQALAARRPATSGCAERDTTAARARMSSAPAVLVDPSDRRPPGRRANPRSIRKGRRPARSPRFRGCCSSAQRPSSSPSRRSPPTRSWRGRARRAWMTRDAFIVAAGIAFPIVVLTALLIRVLLMPADGRARVRATLRIEVVGEQWWWRVHYLDAGRQPRVRDRQRDTHAGRASRSSSRCARPTSSTASGCPRSRPSST